MSGVVRRLAAGLVGQGLWRVAMALNPILLVPVQIAHWRVDLFGQWITASALASYLAYANLGMVGTATNDVIMAVAAGDTRRARHSFQMSCNLAVGPLPVVLIVIIGILATLPLEDWFHLSGFRRGWLILIFIFAGLQLCFETLRGLMAAVLYSTGRYGAVYNVAAIIKLCEQGGAIFAIAVLGAQPVHFAFLTATAALTDLVVLTLLARAAVPWARFDLRVFDLAWFRRQLRPSLGFCGYNLATQGVLVQGPRLVLGGMLGGSVVAVYAVYATAMRLVDQLFLSMMAPASVEISHAAGQGDTDRLVRILAAIVQLSAVAFIAVVLFLMGLGPVFFGWWTHHQIAFHHGLMALYLLMSAAGLFGRIAAQALISVNALRAVAVITLFAACLSVGLGAILVPLLGLDAVLIGGIVGELASSAVLLVALRRWLDLPLPRLLAQIGDIAGSAAHIWGHARRIARRRTI